MKTLREIIIAMAAILACTSAGAVPVTWQFNGAHTRELIDGYVPVLTQNYLFAADSTVSLSFTYDASTPWSLYFPPYNGSTPYYVHDGALTNFVGDVAGHAFSAASDRTKSYQNIYAFDPYYFSAVVSTVVAGDFYHLSQGTGLQGFYLPLAYHLTGFSMTLYGIDNHPLPAGALPETFVDVPPSLQSELTLYFDSPYYEKYEVRFTGSVNPVPLPAAAFVFGSGLLLLGGLRRHRPSRLPTDTFA